MDAYVKRDEVGCVAKGLLQHTLDDLLVDQGACTFETSDLCSKQTRQVMLSSCQAIGACVQIENNFRCRIRCCSRCHRGKKAAN